ncbi:MAG: hypothetical protein OXI71_07650 [Gemmatimonadota bacterium]|nr:hypothetical protein [Gemmatimonadota bacterium]
MSTLIATTLLASAGWLPLGAPAPAADALKCPARGGGPDMRMAVLIVDGEVLPGELEELDPASVGEYDFSSFYLMCWEWIEKYYGVKVQSAGYLAHTKGFVERTRTSSTRALEALIAAQDRYRDEHGGYAGSVEDLAGFAFSDYGLPEFFELTLERANGGWSARVGPAAGWLAEFARRGIDSSPLDACRVFTGAASEGVESATPEAESPPRERQPVCSWAPTG